MARPGWVLCVGREPRRGIGSSLTDGRQGAVIGVSAALAKGWQGATEWVRREMGGLPNRVIVNQMIMHMTSPPSVDHLEDDTQCPWIWMTNNHSGSKLQYLWTETPLDRRSGRSQLLDEEI